MFIPQRHGLSRFQSFSSHSSRLRRDCRGAECADAGVEAARHHEALSLGEEFAMIRKNVPASGFIKHDNGTSSVNGGFLKQIID